MIMDDAPHFHTAWQSIALHVIPGALITAVYIVIGPVATATGYPALLAMLLSIVVVLLPVEPASISRALG
jgi:hypothetical protein